MRRPLLVALLLGAGLAGAGTPAVVPTRPLLAWGDEPPATEVRPLSGARTIVVRYGALAPATFYAELDGDPVTALFHPEPNTAETVELPFIGGRNALKLGASDASGLEHITLERTVVFARLPSDAAAPSRMRSAPELKHELWKQTTPEAVPAGTIPPKDEAPPAAAPATGGTPTGG